MQNVLGMKCCDYKPGSTYIYRVIPRQGSWAIDPFRFELSQSADITWVNGPLNILTKKQYLSYIIYIQME
jgi:hypothetical protein